MGGGDRPRLRRATLRLILSRRRREVTTIAIIGVIAIATLWIAYALDPGNSREFGQGLMVNLGTSLLFVLAAYAWFDRLVQRVRESTTTEWSHLDHDRLIERMAHATRRIMIIEIWTGLLDNQRFHEDFLPMMSRSLKRGVKVVIYLNHPDSEVAKERSAQLVNVDVRQKALLNLGRLRDFVEDEENESKIRNLTVFVGHMHPDIQVYSWDDRALLTFYSTDRPTYDIPQIETHVTNTPWGIFVDNKMEALAQDPATVSLRDYLFIDVEIRAKDDGTVKQPRRAMRYVLAGGLYVRDEWLAEDAVDSARLNAVQYLDGQQVTFLIRRAYGDKARIVKQAFKEKYGMGWETFFELVKVSP